MTKAAVELSGVTKHCGDVIALKGIDLAITDGEFFSLLGRSGCGKTTTLRLIAVAGSETLLRVCPARRGTCQPRW